MILRFSLLERFLIHRGMLPAPLMDGFASVLFGRMFAIAVRRGVFECLAGAPREADDIALRTGLAQRAIGLIMEASSVAGYVHRGRNGYALSRAGRKWLLRESPDSLVLLIGYFETLHHRWMALEEALENGAPPRAYYAGFTSEDWRLYVLAMRDLARFVLPFVIGRITPGTKSRAVLDIGGSHGLYAMELCRRAPGLKATILDFPEALHHTREVVEREGMIGRVTFLPGDFLLTPFPEQQDLVLLFNVVHGLTVEQNETVVKRALDALSPGGKLVILDQCLEDAGRSDLSRFLPLMVGLNLMNEIGGGIATVEEMLRWCSPARSARRIRLPLPGLTLVEAIR